jgi:hypothetical protein
MRNSILTLLDLVQARESAIASTSINQHRFAKPEFVVGSNVDVGLHGSHLEMMH